MSMSDISRDTNISIKRSCVNKEKESIQLSNSEYEYLLQYHEGDPRPVFVPKCEKTDEIPSGLLLTQSDADDTLKYSRKRKHVDSNTEKEHQAMEQKKVRGGLQWTCNFIEPNLRPDVVANIVNPGRTFFTLKSNYVNFKMTLKGPFYMYDIKMPTDILPKNLELLKTLALTRANHFPFCFDGQRLFTTDKWLTDSETISINGNSVSFQFVGIFEKNTEDYYRMVTTIFNNIQINMNIETINNSFFLISCSDVVMSKYGSLVFEEDNLHDYHGFSTTVTRGTNDDGTASMLLHFEPINIILNEDSIANMSERCPEQFLIGSDVIEKCTNQIYSICGIQMRKVEEENDRQTFVIHHSLRKENLENEGEVPKKDYEMFNFPGELGFLCGLSHSERNIQSVGLVLMREQNNWSNGIGDFCKWTKEKNTDELLEEWGIEIDAGPITLKGKEMYAVQLISEGKHINVENSEYWKDGDLKFNINVNYQFRIAILAVDHSLSHFNTFIDQLKTKIWSVHVNCGFLSIDGCTANNIDDYLRQMQSDRINMAVIFLDDADVYVKVKRYTISNRLLTQCVSVANGSIGDHGRRTLIIEDTVRLMFTKLGFIPWSIELGTPNTMIVGLSTFCIDNRLIQASVFNVNDIRYTSFMSFVNSYMAVEEDEDDDDEEFFDHMRSNFIKAIDYYKNNNEQKSPSKFLIYCDDDNFDHSYLADMKNYEVTKIQKIIESIYVYQDRPQIIYIVAKPNISSSFLYDNEQPTRTTVVETGVVKPKFFEFYLVSQRSTATNYKVLLDTQKQTRSMDNALPINVNQIQRITYELTHLCYNNMGPISVPAPIFYAHRLAELMGNVSRGMELPVKSEELDHLLFYI